MPEDVGFKKLNVTIKRATVINASKSNRRQWDRVQNNRKAYQICPDLHAGGWMICASARDGSFKTEHLHRGRKLYSVVATVAWL